MLDIPFSMRQPVTASVMQFTSWSFGATANYLLPLLQRADAQKVVSMMLMMMAGSMVGPLRQLSAGEEVDLSAGNLFKEMWFNSGILGIYGDMIARLNGIFNLPFVPHKYKSKGVGDLLLGPAGGMAQLMVDIVNGGLSGEFTESDLRRTVRILPYLNAFYLRPVKKQWIEALHLKKIRGQITPPLILQQFQLILLLLMELIILLF